MRKEEFEVKFKQVQRKISLKKHDHLSSIVPLPWAKQLSGG